jgi:hypothetical protein
LRQYLGSLQVVEGRAKPGHDTGGKTRRLSPKLMHTEFNAALI